MQELGGNQGLIFRLSFGAFIKHRIYIWLLREFSKIEKRAICFFALLYIKAGRQHFVTHFFLKTFFFLNVTFSGNPTSIDVSTTIVSGQRASAENLFKHNFRMAFSARRNKYEKINKQRQHQNTTGQKLWVEPRRFSATGGRAARWQGRTLPAGFSGAF